MLTTHHTSLSWQIKYSYSHAGVTHTCPQIHVIKGSPTIVCVISNLWRPLCSISVWVKTLEQEREVCSNYIIAFSLGTTQWAIAN
jgi:hypothetical protein